MILYRQLRIFILVFIIGPAHQFNSAVNSYKKALEIDPNYGEAHEELGTTYLARREFDKAINEFELAMKLSNEKDSIIMLLRKSYTLDGIKGYLKKSIDFTIKKFRGE